MCVTERERRSESEIKEWVGETTSVHFVSVQSTFH